MVDKHTYARRRLATLPNKKHLLNTKNINVNVFGHYHAQSVLHFLIHAIYRCGCEVRISHNDPKHCLHPQKAALSTIEGKTGRFPGWITTSQQFKATNGVAGNRSFQLETEICWLMWLRRPMCFSVLHNVQGYLTLRWFPGPQTHCTSLQYCICTLWC